MHTTISFLIQAYSILPEVNNSMVVHARIKDLASGFIKVAGKEVDKVKDALVDVGKAKAIDVACKAIESRTGLPNSICNRAGELVVDTLIKEVKQKLS